MLDTTLKVKTLEVELDLERFTNSEIVKNIEKKNGNSELLFFFIYREIKFIFFKLFIDIFDNFKRGVFIFGNQIIIVII